MPTARRIRNFAALITLAALAAAPVAATAQTPGGGVVTQATVIKLNVKPTSRTYPVFNAAGQKVGAKSWRVTTAGGNCCEVYITAGAGGRLIEFGGTYPIYSDDRGISWYQVTPVTPLINGEGAVVAGPGGSIEAIGWDAYSGDHLQSFKYDPATKSWDVAEVTLHQPFYDRPWITLARGPFTIDGQKVPYVTVVRGGYPFKDPELLSTDGLTYSRVTSPGIDELSTSPASGPVKGAASPASHNPIADYWQPHPGAGTIPLSGGGLLQRTQPNDGDLATCGLSRLRQMDGKWQCYSLPTKVRGTVRQDSRGWLTQVAPAADGKSLGLKLSKDGGTTWSAPIALRPPNHGTLEASNYDVKVNGALGVAAVSARFDNAKSQGQDMLFRVNVGSLSPKVTEIEYLGKGDINTANDAGGSAGDRFDYATVAILPDGSLTASFQDSTTLASGSQTKHDPWLAVESSGN